MHLLYRITLLLCVTLLFSGCSALGGKSSAEKVAETKANVDWSYAKDGIWIELASDIDLNFYANQSHALVLGVWQVGDEKVFVKLLTDRSALSSAMATGNLPKDILQLDRFVIQPDTRLTLKLDRVQGAKYVGLVAGYYSFDAARSVRYFRIPLNIKSSGLISKDYTAEPSVLALRLLLGSQRIANAESLTYDAEKKVVLETVPLSNEKLEINLSPSVLNQAARESSSVIKLGQ